MASTPNIAQIADRQLSTFLHAIWGTGPHSVCTVIDGRFRAVFTDDPDHLLHLLPRWQNRDTWIGAHPLRHEPVSGRGGRDDVASVSALHADLDWAHPSRSTDDPLPAEQEIRDRLGQVAATVRPSIIVHSGHGLQAWWLLSYPVDPLRGEALMARLDVLLDSHGLSNGRSDLASILRLPGTRNHKDPDQVVPVVIETLHEKWRYTPEWLEKHLPDAAPIAVGTATRHTPGVVTDTQQNLADHLQVQHGGHDPRIAHDGSIYLWRPGKARRDGQWSAHIIVGDHGDAIATIFTDHWPGLPPGQYMLGPDGQLHHPSELTAHILVDTSQPAPPDRRLTGQPDDEDDSDTDWEIDWTQHHDPADDLVDRLIIPGRWLQVVAPAKAGKSTLLLYTAIQLSLGFEPYDGNPVPPAPVIYYDGEMGRADLEDLIQSCGHDPRQLPNLHCMTTPAHRLDHPAPVSTFLAQVDRIGAKLVVLDGLNSFVNPGASENDDTAWRPFYTLTIIPLKKRGIAVVSGDNLGKDHSKGARGSSVKPDKADGVVQVTLTDNGVRLRVTHARAGAYLDEMHLDATGFDRATPIEYRRSLTSWPGGTADAARLLDRLGIPLDAGRPAVRARLRAEVARGDAQCSMRNDVLAAALRYRRLAIFQPGRKIPNAGPGQTSGTVEKQTPGDNDGDSAGTAHPEDPKKEP